MEKEAIQEKILLPVLQAQLIQVLHQHRNLQVHLRIKRKVQKLPVIRMVEKDGVIQRIQMIQRDQMIQKDRTIQGIRMDQNLQTMKEENSFL